MASTELSALQQAKRQPQEQGRNRRGRREWRMDLPGFRFHPTEEELLDCYLRQIVHGRKQNFDVIGNLNIYLHDPWELPGLAKIGEREWYFFVPRDRRSGGRRNRTTACGFWKATGSDRLIRSAAEPRRFLGVKKTLVFYRGRAARGTKTDWVMNEYRLPDAPAGDVHFKEDVAVVLCKVYRKATSLKELEQRAAKTEEEEEEDTAAKASASNVSSSEANLDAKEETKREAATPARDIEILSSSSVVRPMILPELQVPKSSLEWLQEDPLSLTQLRSPWMELWSPLWTQRWSPWMELWSPCADILLHRP